MEHVPEFEAFVEANGVRLLRLAFLLTGEQHDAEDLAQDALTRIQSRWIRVSSADDPVAYARRILINHYLNGKRRRVVTVALREDPTSSQAPDPAEFVGNKDLLRRALSRLPVRQRTVLVLRYYEDATTPEISSIMGISESSVRSALSRGLENLRGWIRMEALENDDEIVRRRTKARTARDR
jgi:RNA polymerase sigma-70 factor (sigma-E family)